jgi:hypothetical protein
MASNSAVNCRVANGSTPRLDRTVHSFIRSAPGGTSFLCAGLQLPGPATGGAPHRSELSATADHLTGATIAAINSAVVIASPAHHLA